LACEGVAPENWTLSLLQPERDYLGALASPCPDMTVRACRLLPAQPAASH